MSTQPINENGTELRTASAVDLKLEVVVIPVADVDRAKRFYAGLGWRLDDDFANGDNWRLVQMTPPGSPCSVMFGKGFTSAEPGSLQVTTTHRPTASCRRSITRYAHGESSQSVFPIPRPALDGLTPLQHLSDFHRVAINHSGHDYPNGQAILLHRVRLSVMA